MEREKSIGKDATSKETLQDLEDNEAESDTSDDSEMPSPDGAFDDSEDLKNADPL